MEDAEIEAAKAGLRRKAHQQRAALGADARAEAARAAAHHFLAKARLPKTDIVALYWPIRDEIDCKPLLAALMDAYQPVCLPVVMGENQPLEMRLWEQGAPLYPSGFGTLAPAETAPVVSPDCIVVPLLGFDRFGTRLGYGGGYYDRTLAGMARAPKLIGIAFAAQEVERIPRADHDVPLDAIVTEKGYRAFARPEEDI